MSHPTRVISVKAPIDVEVIPLVEAFNRVPYLATVYSCQGDDTSPVNGAAYVTCVDTDENRHRLVDVAHILVRAFRTDDNPDRPRYLEISIVWADTMPQLRLRVHRVDILYAAALIDRELGGCS
jgi:hypothetical protein